jgi:hypothetical protein
VIFAHRTTAHAVFQGLNVVIVRDWLQPLENLPLTCFKAFDETLTKLRADREATRILPPGMEGAELTRLGELHTAEEAARRALPERYRGATSFFTVALEPARGDRAPCVLSSLPAWARLWVEDTRGQLDALRINGPRPPWLALPLTNEDRFLQIAFFTDEPRLRLSQEEAFGVRRLARLIEESLTEGECLRIQLVVPREDSSL